MVRPIDLKLIPFGFALCTLATVGNAGIDSFISLGGRRQLNLGFQDEIVEDAVVGQLKILLRSQLDFTDVNGNIALSTRLPTC